jgi:hypothetical protein
MESTSDMFRNIYPLRAKDMEEWNSAIYSAWMKGH